MLVMLASMCASNNELQHEYNSNDDIPQRFEVLQSLKIELKWHKRNAILPN